MEGLRIKDLDENSSPSCRVRFSHDVLNMLFNRLFGDLKRIGNFFICPAFGKVFDNLLLAIGQLEPFSGMFRIQVLLPA